MSAVTPKCSSYSRRRPELTPCYKIIADHFNTFVRQREIEGRPLPEYVIREFDKYLKCGIYSYGFLRLKCADCGKELIVAFSCKNKFCPSCCAKRSAEAAAHLIDNVLPVVPYRQFVVTFPIAMRFWMASNKKLFSKIHTLVIKQIQSFYIKKAKLAGIKSSMPGCISFTQRWGSALNLNVHLHILFMDGVYTAVNEKAQFRNTGSINDVDVAEIIEGISKRVRKYLKNKGYLDKDGQIVDNPILDDMFAENPALAAAAASSICGKIAFGPNTGKRVTKIGAGFGFEQEIALAKGHLCYSVNGFSLHARTSTNTHQRDKLEKLIEYISRGPLSNERLSITDDNKVKLQLKTPYSDGTTHLLFSFCEFIEKLVALIPPPKAHSVRWAGCFAPNSPLRKLITLKPAAKKGFDFDEPNAEAQKLHKNYSSWSKMLARVFKIDILVCTKCCGKLKPVCAVLDSGSIQRYLKHENMDYEPPARAPPRDVQTPFEFDQDPAYGDELPVINLD